jgi:MFS transporter, SP family, general alpha glucoside:H+ symporter
MRLSYSFTKRIPVLSLSQEIHTPKMAASRDQFMDLVDINDIVSHPDFESAVQIANEEEHSLSFFDACRRYRPAIFWAIAISFTIIMEGYDTILMGNFFAYPEFNKKYGTWNPASNQYVISARWQSLLSDMSSVGSIIGLLINGFVTERFGHRRVIMVGMATLSGCIFFPFFAPNLTFLVIGQLLCGIPWGSFAIMGSSYASEVCPLALRGFLTAFVSICWVTGMYERSIFFYKTARGKILLLTILL